MPPTLEMDSEEGLLALALSKGYFVGQLGKGNIQPLHPWPHPHSRSLLIPTAMNFSDFYK